MGKLFIIIGKSATGKDTIYKKLLEHRSNAAAEETPEAEAIRNIKTVVGYTTRPIRAGERNGVEYFFVTVEELERMRAEGRLIEQRTYHTMLGDWHYFTADDGQIDLTTNNYLFITTLEGYEQIRSFYGEELVVPLYVEVSDKERLLRAIAREEGQAKPNYDEVCRRYLADEADFCEKELVRLGIKKRFLNDTLENCISAMLLEIEQQIASEGADILGTDVKQSEAGQ